MQTDRAFALLIATLLICFLRAVPARAQGVQNVLVVVNEQSTASEKIGEYYVERRRIPDDHLLRVSVEPVDEITRGAFLHGIQRPVATWIAERQAHDRILYIVLTKGIPLRIKGSGGRNGTVASVDSELTLLYRRLLGEPVSTAGRLDNPYFLGDQPPADFAAFSHELHDIYLVTRLDGYTVDDVLVLIERGSTPATEGSFLLDPKSTNTERGGDAWLLEASNELAALDLADRTSFGGGPEVLRDKDNVLGYYSWGSNDPAITTRHLGLEFAPGALAGMFVSTDGRTFEEPPEDWDVGLWTNRRDFFARSPQSLIGDLIRSGATGVGGHVAEPYLNATVRPQILFPTYMRGANLAEAFYLAMPYLSWQNVVIGDPLCAPLRREQLDDAVALPPLDAETELPAFFSSRRMAALVSKGTPAEIAALLVLAASRNSRDDRNGAREALEEATELDPSQFDAYLTLASMDEEDEAYDDAIARYRILLDLDPDHIIVLNNLAYSLAVKKESPEEALPIAENAYRLSRGIAQVADTLGWIHHLLGNRVDSTRLLTEASRALPHDPTVHLHLAHAQAAIGSREEARASLSTALELDATLEGTPEVVQLQGEL